MFIPLLSSSIIIGALGSPGFLPSCSIIIILHITTILITTHLSTPKSTQVVRTIQKKPDMIKSLFKGRVDEKNSGMSEEQILGFVDYVSTLPEWLLMFAGKTINWGVGVAPTVMAT